MSRIIHLSDLHFGAATPKMAERLLGQINEISPDLVVISGDLTQRAKSDEFREAAEFIKQLKNPHLVVPGNHDLAGFRLHERLFYPWQRWKKYISPELEPVVSSNGVIGIGLNTARRLSMHLDWSRGRINMHQLDRIKTEFADSPPECVRVVVTHHPFYLNDASKSRGLIGRLNMAWPRLVDAKVDLILSGHIHLAYAQVFHGMVVAHAGSGISHRLKGEANSFNLITASHAQIEIQQMHWHEGSFIAGNQQSFGRLEAGFVEVGNQKLRAQSSEPRARI